MGVDGSGRCSGSGSDGGILVLRLGARERDNGEGEMDDEANVARAGADARLGGGGGVAMDVDRSKNDEVFGESLVMSEVIVARAGRSSRGFGGVTSGAQDVVKRSLRDDVDDIRAMAPKLVLEAAVIPRREGGRGGGGPGWLSHDYKDVRIWKEGSGKWERQRKSKETKGKKG